MKVIFERHIVAKPGGVTPLRKVVELSFAPFIGMEVEDPVLHRNEPCFKVEHVKLCLGYSDTPPWLLVSLGAEELETLEGAKERVRIYQSHQWQFAEEPA